MSAYPRPELVASGTVPLPAAWPRLVALVALFVRIGVGLSLFNPGLVRILTPGPGGFGGPGGMVGPGFRPAIGALTPTLPGFEGVAAVLPYAELAVGVGLILGIFTTISALAACAITLVSPALMAVSLMLSAGIGPMPNRFGLAFEYLLATPHQALLAQALLVLLSPVAINRYSIDALIFARAAVPIVPQPPATAFADPAPAAEAAPAREIG
jgi:hypothetical protein